MIQLGFNYTRTASLLSLPFRPSSNRSRRPVSVSIRRQRSATCNAAPVAAAAAGAVTAPTTAAPGVALFAAATVTAAKKHGIAAGFKGVPWLVIVPVALLVAVFLLRFVLRSLTRRGSLSGLEDRGMLNAQRDKQETFYKDVMRKVNTVDIEPLSEEQIMAARKRRSKERDPVLNVDDIELPSNHPFAVNQQLSAEEEQLIKDRLSARRGLPVQDLEGSRGLSEDRDRGGGAAARGGSGGGGRQASEEGAGGGGGNAARQAGRTRPAA